MPAESCGDNTPPDKANRSEGRPDGSARKGRGIDELSGATNTGARLNYYERARRDLIARALARHECDLLCPERVHPGCPHWRLARGYLDLPRHDPRWHAVAARVPGLVEAFERDCKTAERLGPVIDDGIRIADILPDEIVEVMTRAVLAASPKRRAALACALYPAFRPYLQNLLADELPDAIAVLGEGVQS